MFKRITTLDRINEQIMSVEKSLLESQYTADHYAALADGSKRTLVRLRSMQDAEVRGTEVRTLAQPPVVEKPLKLRAAK